MSSKLLKYTEKMLGKLSEKNEPTEIKIDETLISEGNTFKFIF